MDSLNYVYIIINIHLLVVFYFIFVSHSSYNNFFSQEMCYLIGGKGGLSRIPPSPTPQIIIKENKRRREKRKLIWKKIMSYHLITINFSGKPFRLKPFPSNPESFSTTFSYSFCSVSLCIYSCVGVKGGIAC